MSTRAALLVAALLSACGSSPTSSPDAAQALDAAGAPADAAAVPADAAIETQPDASAGLDAAEAPGPDAAARQLQGTTVLGEGGFFGTSAKDLGRAHGAEELFAIGAHYAELPAATGTEKQGGRVYLFKKGALPTSLAAASEVLEPPDLSVLGGFGYALGNTCDLDHDGFPDLPVGNHLFSDKIPNAGRIVVFWGDSSGTFSSARSTTHTLAADVQASSDCFGQTVLCADFDGDGIDDLLGTGQNAGVANTGLGGIFHGKANVRLPPTPDALISPTLAAKSQYFGSASVFEDLDGDGVRDLAIGAWGLIRGAVATGPHTGGISIFKGGADWTTPTFQVTPGGKNETQMGSSVVAFSTPRARWLAATAPDYDAKGGAVLVYKTGDATLSQGVPAHVLQPPAGMSQDDFGSAVAYAPDYFGKDRGALLVGARYARAAGVDGAGVVLVFGVEPNGAALEETPTVLTAPQPASGDSFGSMIQALGDLDGDGLGDFAVGIPEHLEGDAVTGKQTGGVVFFH